MDVLAWSDGVYMPDDKRPAETSPVPPPASSDGGGLGMPSLDDIMGGVGEVQSIPMPTMEELQSGGMPAPSFDPSVLPKTELLGNWSPTIRDYVPDAIEGTLIGTESATDKAINEYKKATGYNALTDVVGLNVTSEVKKYLDGTSRSRGALANEIYRREKTKGSPLTQAERTATREELREEFIRGYLRYKRPLGGKPAVLIDDDPDGTNQALANYSQAAPSGALSLDSLMLTVAERIDPTDTSKNAIAWREEVRDDFMPRFFTLLQTYNTMAPVAALYEAYNGEGSLPDSMADFVTPWIAALMPYEQEAYIPIENKDGTWDYASGKTQGAQGFAGGLAYYSNIVSPGGGFATLANFDASGGEWGSPEHLDFNRKMRGVADNPKTTEFIKTAKWVNFTNLPAEALVEAAGYGETRNQVGALTADLALSLLEPDLVALGLFSTGASARKAGDIISETFELGMDGRLARGERAMEDMSAVVEPLAAEPFVDFFKARRQGELAAIDPLLASLDLEQSDTMKRVNADKSFIQKMTDLVKHKVDGKDPEMAALVALGMNLKAMLGSNNPVSGLTSRAARMFADSSRELEKLRMDLGQFGVKLSEGGLGNAEALAVRKEMSALLYAESYLAELKVYREAVQRMARSTTEDLLDPDAYKALQADLVKKFDKYRNAHAEYLRGGGNPSDLTSKTLGSYETARMNYHQAFNKMVRHSDDKAAGIFDGRIGALENMRDISRANLKTLARIEGMTPEMVNNIARFADGVPKLARIAEGQAQANFIGVLAHAVDRTKNQYRKARAVRELDVSEFDIARGYEDITRMVGDGTMTEFAYLQLVDDTFADGSQEFLDAFVDAVSDSPEMFEFFDGGAVPDAPELHRAFERGVEIRLNQTFAASREGMLPRNLDRALDRSTVRRTFGARVRNLQEEFKKYLDPARMQLVGNAELVQIQKGLIDQSRFLSNDLTVLSRLVKTEVTKRYRAWTQEFRRVNGRAPKAKEIQAISRSIDTAVKKEIAIKYVDNVEVITTPDSGLTGTMFKTAALGGTVLNTLDNKSTWGQYREILTKQFVNLDNQGLQADNLVLAMVRAFVPRGAALEGAESAKAFTQFDAKNLNSDFHNGVLDALRGAFEAKPDLSFEQFMEIIRKQTSRIIEVQKDAPAVRLEEPLAYMMAAQAVAHGAILSRGYKQIRSHLSGFTRADIGALVKMETNDFGSLTADKLAMSSAMFERLGIPARMSRLHTRGMEKIDAGFQLLEGTDLIMPRSAIKAMEAGMDDIIKSPEQFDVRKTDTFASEWAKTQSSVFAHLKVGMLTGHLLPRASYLTTNLFGNAAAIWSVAGPQAALSSSAALAIDMGQQIIRDFDPMILGKHIPFVGNKLDGALKRTADFARTNFPLPSPISTYMNPHLDRFVRGTGMERVSGKHGRVWRISELRKLAVEEGIFVSQAQAELQDLMMRHKPSTFAPYRGVASVEAFKTGDFSTGISEASKLAMAKAGSAMSNHKFYLDIVQNVEQRQRSALFLHLIVNDGMSPQAAGKIARKSVYDWNHAATPAELKLLGNIPLFYRFLRVSMQQALEIMYEPMVTGYKGGTGLNEAMVKSMGISSINDSAWALTNTRTLHETEKAFIGFMHGNQPPPDETDNPELTKLAERGPWYAKTDTRSTLGHGPLDVADTEFYSQWGREYNAYRIPMPALTTLETMGQIMSAQTAIASIVAMPIADHFTEKDLFPAHTVQSAGWGTYDWVTKSTDPVRSTMLEQFGKYMRGKSTFFGDGTRISPTESVVMRGMQFDKMGLIHQDPDDHEAIWRANPFLMDIWRLMPYVGNEMNTYGKAVFHAAPAMNQGDYARATAVMMGELTGVSRTQIYDASKRTGYENKYELAEFRLGMKRTMERNSRNRTKADEAGVVLPK